MFKKREKKGGTLKRYKTEEEEKDEKSEGEESQDKMHKKKRRGKNNPNFHEVILSPPNLVLDGKHKEKKERICG